MKPALREQHAGGAIPSLDGIRAIAVMLVFVAHSGMEHLVPGGLGVTIFFVLSGFLISTLMRVEQGRYGYINYKGFYLRRLLRLMPPLVVIVTATAALSLAGLIEGGYTLGGLLSTLFYFGNYFVIFQDYEGVPAGIGIVWSLAVEEHYYVFYPPLAALLLRIGRAGLSVSIIGGLCILVLGWRCWLAVNGVPESYISVATDTRVDAILVGCLMALLFNPWLDPSPEKRPLQEWAVAALCLMALVGSLLYRDEFFRLTFRYTVQSFAIAGLMYLAVARSAEAPYKWLNCKVLMYVGTISYTVYLSHHVILMAISAHWPHWNWITGALAGAVLTLAVAEPMRRWVEQPCAQLRKRLHSQPTPRTATNLISGHAS